MNKENLLKIADYIETVPQEMFDMEEYRDGDDYSIECNSVGCAIGHSTILFPEIAEKHRIKEGQRKGRILFGYFSKEVTGLEEEEWSWCFNSMWRNIDNTPTGAAKRIRMLANGEVPTAWLIEWRDWTNIKY